jgi:hypothetical protein
MKLEQLMGDLILYFQVDVENLKNYINMAVQRRNQEKNLLKSATATSGVGSFQTHLDNVNNLQQSIDYMQKRESEARRYILFFKKIFKNSDLVNKIKDVIKE